ncbi:MAG: helix-turn-helix domain-containing protein [Ruminococcus sp.]|nr:helix-turn-helix domain-containing protein [Ruminococcus sp.]
MSDIGTLIRTRREELGMTQDELAEKIGYKSRSSINKIEKGGNDLPRSKITAFAKALDISPSLFIDESVKTENVESLIEKYSNIFPVQLKSFPLLGEIACGRPIFASEDKERYIMADMGIDADFCLKAKGDSMINARIYDGDIVFIREMPMVENGDIAAVIINDEATLKKVYYYPQNSKLVLYPENPAYEPFIYIGEELDSVRILGKAVYFMSRL